MYANKEPEKICPAKHKHAISVRRSSVPLKQSKYELPLETSNSRLFVCTIRESVSLGSICAPFAWIRRRTASASSRRPFLTKCHGDSGAKHRIGNIKTGQAHWRAKGMRNAHSHVLLPDKADKTPAAINWPIIKHLEVG